MFIIFVKNIVHTTTNLELSKASLCKFILGVAADFAIIIHSGSGSIIAGTLAIDVVGFTLSGRQLIVVFHFAIRSKL